MKLVSGEKSSLVMAWCHKAMSHYLSQCWPRSRLSHAVIRPYWIYLSTFNHKMYVVCVKDDWSGKQHYFIPSYGKWHIFNITMQQQILSNVHCGTDILIQNKQLECLHDYPYQWFTSVPKSKQDKVKVTKNAKNSNFEIMQETVHATHLLKSLDKMYQYKMDQTRTVGITERTRNAWRMDGQSETNITPIITRWWVLYNCWNSLFWQKSLCFNRKSPPGNSCCWTYPYTKYLGPKWL